MVEQKIRVYSGTTLENFVTCAVQVGDGAYFYEKDREPRLRRNPQTYYVLNQGDAVGWAIGHAVDIEATGATHTPAIISGKVSKKYETTYALAPGEALVVDEIWLPDPESDWKTNNQGTLFVAHSPTKVLVDFAGDRAVTIFP